MKSSRGFSLLEVLITLLLTTIGILGMVALQSKGIQYTQDAVNRNNAVSLVNDLIEIMRQHPEEFWEVQSGESRVNNFLLRSTGLYKSDGSLNITGTCPTTGQPQTFAQQAACWVKRVDDTLPGASEASIKKLIKVCPSFKMEEGSPACAGSNYRGSGMGIQIGWKVREGECLDGTENEHCTYHTRIEL